MRNLHSLICALVIKECSDTIQPFFFFALALALLLFLFLFSFLFLFLFRSRMDRCCAPIASRVPAPPTPPSPTPSSPACLFILTTTDRRPPAPNTFTRCPSPHHSHTGGAWQ